MAQRTLMLLMLALFLPTLVRGDNAPKGDKDLEGDWEVVSSVRDAKDLLAAGGKIVMTFTADSMTAVGGDADEKGAIRVNASKTPKTIDVTLANGLSKGMTIAGLYEIKGDELRLCTAKPRMERPTELSPKEGSGWMLTTGKRVKK